MDEGNLTMAYVEAHAGLRDHLKTKKVARLLGVPKVQVIGHMLCLWWWCQEYAQNGNLAQFDNADVAEAAEWDGDPDTFVNALLTCGPKGGAGFLTHNDNEELIVNDWYQYGGKLFTAREQSAKRMRNYRARNADVTRNDSVTVTHVTPIDKIRIDKIRGDKKINNSSPNGEAHHAHVEPLQRLPSEQQSMFGAIADVCQLDMQLKRGQIAKQSKAMLDAGYTSDDVRAFGEWWRSDSWRVEHTPVPSIAQMVDRIKQVKQANGQAKQKVKRYTTDPVTGESCEIEVTL